MRANQPGVGASPARRGELDLCTARRGYWIDLGNNWIVNFDQLNSSYEDMSVLNNGTLVILCIIADAEMGKILFKRKWFAIQPYY